MNIRMDVTSYIDPTKPEKLGEAVRTALLGSAIIVEGQAIQLCPVDTGRLRGSITHQMKGQVVSKSDTASRARHPATQADVIDVPDDKYTASVGTNVEYAEFVEYGTQRTKAQPYMRPALYMSLFKIVSYFGKKVRQVLRG